MFAKIFHSVDTTGDIQLFQSVQIGSNGWHVTNEMSFDLKV